MCTRVLLMLVVATLCVACEEDRSGATDPARANSPPDITGLWQRVGIRGGANPATSGDQNLPGEPPLPPPQFTPEYQAKHDENLRLLANEEYGARRGEPNSVAARSLLGKCPPYGMPLLMGEWLESLDIAQTANHITVIAETTEVTEVRRIWLDREQKAVADVEPGYFGRSVGKWEGDVLVVNTIGIKPDVGEPHSEQMVIHERIYLKDGYLLDDLTITDPLSLEKPWTYSQRYERVAPTDYEPAEGTCENTDQYRFDEKGNLVVAPER